MTITFNRNDLVTVDYYWDGRITTQHGNKVWVRNRMDGQVYGPIHVTRVQLNREVTR